MMTLEEFRATRTEVEDLGQAFADDQVDNWEEPTAGYIYTFTHGTDEARFYIEKHADGRVYLILERSEWLEPPEQLPLLESLLYNWAHDEMVPKDER